MLQRNIGDKSRVANHPKFMNNQLFVCKFSEEYFTNINQLHNCQQSHTGTSGSAEPKVTSITHYIAHNCTTILAIEYSVISISQQHSTVHTDFRPFVLNFAMKPLLLYRMSIRNGLSVKQTHYYTAFISLVGNHGNN